jgi:hypothetical protein
VNGSSLLHTFSILSMRRFFTNRTVTNTGPKNAKARFVITKRAFFF